MLLRWLGLWSLCFGWARAQFFLYGLADMDGRGVWDWVRFNTLDGTDLIPELLACTNYTPATHYPVASFLQSGPSRLTVVMKESKPETSALNLVATLFLDKAEVEEWRFFPTGTGLLWGAPEGECQAFPTDGWWMISLLQLENGTISTQWLTLSPGPRQVAVRHSLGAVTLNKCGCDKGSIWAQGADAASAVLAGLYFPSLNPFFTVRLQPDWVMVTNIFVRSSNTSQVPELFTIAHMANFSASSSAAAGLCKREKTPTDSPFYLGVLQRTDGDVARFRPLVCLPFFCPTCNFTVGLHRSPEVPDSLFITSMNSCLTEVLQFDLRPDQFRVVQHWILLAQLVSPLQVVPQKFPLSPNI